MIVLPGLVIQGRAALRCLATAAIQPDGSKEFAGSAMTRARTIFLAGLCMAIGVVIGVSLPKDSPPSVSPGSVGGSDYPPDRTSVRNVFSPDIDNDEFVRRERLKMVETLEQHCRATGEDCQLAVAARQALTRQ